MHSAILFYSTNYAISAEKVLKENNFKYKMIPVPRNLSSDCGSCISISTNDVPEIKALFNQYGVEFDRIEEMND